MKHIGIIIALAAALFLAGCAAVLDRDSALAVAPYDIHKSGLIVVAVEIDGQGPFDFALDSAASITVVFDELRDKLALDPVPDKAVIIHGAMTSGQFPLLAIGRLEVGQEAWIEPRIASMPGEGLGGTGIAGILGVDFLRRYAVGFSIADRAVRLYAPDLIGARSYRGWTSIPLEPERVGKSGAAIYYFDVEIGGRRIPAIFDLGAGLNMVNRPAAESLGVDLAGLHEAAPLTGAIETGPIMAWFEVEEVSTGRVRWENEVFSVADLAVFELLAPGGGPIAIVGAGLFIQRDFIIDFARSRLLVDTAKDEGGIADTKQGLTLSRVVLVR